MTSRTIKLCVVAFTCILYISLMIFKDYAWVLRLIASLVLITMAGGILVIFGANPKYRIIKGGKLASNGSIQKRAIAERTFKVLFIILGTLVIWFLLFPLARGSYILLKGGSLEIVSGKVTSTSSYMGTWFIAQGIKIDGKQPSLQYFFSVERPVRVGARYTVNILPTTHFVLNLIPHQGEETDNSVTTVNSLVGLRGSYLSGGKTIDMRFLDGTFQKVHVQ